MAWTEKRALATGALRATCAARGLNFLAPTRRMAAALAATAEVERTANMLESDVCGRVGCAPRGAMGWEKKRVTVAQVATRARIRGPGRFSGNGGAETARNLSRSEKNQKF